MAVSLDVRAPEATRERVLRLADALFARRGYAAVSMREVAAAAGVTKPALYYHFRDKEALFEECLLLDQQRLNQLLREAAGGGDFRERIEAVALVLITGSPHHPVRTQADVAEHLAHDVRQRLARSWYELVMGPILDLFGDAEAASEMRDGSTATLAAAALLGIAMAHLHGLTSPDGSAFASDLPKPRDDGDAAMHAARIITALLIDGVGAR